MRCVVIDIRGNKKRILRRYLVVLYILNLIDLFFRKYLLIYNQHLFKESSILMETIISGITPYVIKIGAMAVILLYWYWRSQWFTIKKINISINFSIGLLTTYFIINIIHLIYLFMY